MLLTNAPLGSQQLAAFEMAATETHQWQAVVAPTGVPTRPTGGANGAARISKGRRGGGDGGGGDTVAVLVGGDDGGARDAPTSDAAATATVAAHAGKRYEGHCEFWNVRGGWGRLVAHDVADRAIAKLFVHNTALREGFLRRRGMHVRGAVVSFAVGANAKGPMAIEVDLIKPPPSRAPASGGADGEEDVGEAKDGGERYGYKGKGEGAAAS